MKTLTQAQRIRAYDIAFPNSVSREGNSIHYIHNGRIIGYWIIGNLYKRNFYKNPGGYYGAYPHKFPERCYAQYPDCFRWLHLFSGTMRPTCSLESYLDPKAKLESQRAEITFDLDPNLEPTICGDIRNFETIPNLKEAVNASDFILADPMYDKPDFEKHGQKSFSKTRVLQNLAKYIRPGAFLGWLDTRMPMFSSESWNNYSEIAVRVSTNTRMRGFVVLRRK